MKLKNCKKLVLPTVMAALLVSIPVSSNASSKTSNCVTISSIGGYYTVVANPSKTTSTPSDNYTVVSRGNYFRTKYNTNNSVQVPKNDTTKPVEKPENNTTKPVEKPENNTTKPVEKPENNTTKPVEKPENTTTKPVENVQSKPQEEVTSNGSHSLSAEEIKMVELVNKERQAAGLKPLQIDVDLAYVARVKSQDMNDKKYFSHDSPTYGSPFDMMKQFGIKYRGAAENIAKNQNVESAHNSLMRSSGHKANIMNSNYTHIGIGIVNGYYTQMFISK